LFSNLCITDGSIVCVQIILRMKTFLRSLISLVIVAISLSNTFAQVSSPLNSSGRDFYIAELVPSIKCGAIKPYQGFFVLVSSFYDCNVTVSYFDPNSSPAGQEIPTAPVHIVAKHGLQIALDQGYMNPRDNNGNPIAPNGEQGIYATCHIHADKPISVQYYSTGPNSTGMYLALPTQALGKRYVVASLPTNPGYGAANSSHFACTIDSASSEFGIVSVSDNTHVTITPNGLTRGGHVGVSSGLGATGAKHPFTVTLTRGQSYWVKSVLNDPLDDMSGSVVVSDQPVAVIAGNENAYHGETAFVSAGGDQRNMTVQQMIPVDYWTSSGYVSMPFFDATGGASSDASAGDEYKFFIYDSTNTTLSVYTDGPRTPTLNEFGVASIPNVLTGLTANSNNSQRFFAEQYDYRAMYTATEPFTAPAQMNVVPLGRWCTRFMWYVADDKAQVHKRRYINVVARRDLFPKILLSHNGGALLTINSYLPAGAGNTPAVCSIPGHPELVGKRFEVSPGAWYAKSDSAFIVYQYGMLGLDPDMDLGDSDDDDYYDEYAAPCGQSFHIDGALTPQLSVDTTCNGWRITATDLSPIDQGLASLELLKDPEGVIIRKPGTDSGYISTNVDFLQHSITVIPGVDSVSTQIIIDDPLKNADAWIMATNVAGNDTLIHLQYLAPRLSFYSTYHSDSATFYNSPLGTDTCTQFILKNDGSATFTALGYDLANGSQGFRVTNVSRQLPYRLGLNDSIVFSVCFNANQPSHVYLDTLRVHTDCPTAFGALYGSTSVGEIETEDYDFGPVPLGTKKCHGIKVWNVGKAPFLLTKSWLLDNMTNFIFADSALLPVRIDTGIANAKTFTFCYSPTQDSMKDTTTMHWASDLPSPFEHQKKDFSNLYGYGIKPDLSWNPGEQEFGSQNTRVRRFYLRNVGTAPVIVDSMKIAGPEGREYKIKATEVGSLTHVFIPEDSIWVDIEFSPDTTNVHGRIDTLIAYDDNNIDPIAILYGIIGYSAVGQGSQVYEGLRIVPDPVTTDQVQIFVPTSFEGEYKLIVTDELGRVVRNSDGEGSAVALSVDGLPSGTYFVRAYRQNDMRTGIFKILR